MLPYLERYPNSSTARQLREGFCFGLKIPSLAQLSNQNLASAYAKPDIVLAKMSAEVALGRISGPFCSPPVENLRVSPLGLVPKNELCKFCFIHHLPYPEGSSVNDGVKRRLFGLVYCTSFDEVVKWVRRCGEGSLMAKMDIESAFRLLPVHPDSFWLLCIYWQGQYFVDCCLHMGCSISCAYFEMFSTFL